MKKDIIFLKEFSFNYVNDEYGFDEIEKRYMFFKNLKVIILEESIYIKAIPLQYRFGNLEKYIENKIVEIFPQDGKILYDYEKSNEKNCVYIYAIRGKDKIEKLCSESVSLEVLPIQFIIKDILNIILRKKEIDVMALVKLDDIYYFIKCSNGLLIDNYVSEDILKIYDYLDEKNFQGKIIVDKKCSVDEYFLRNLEIIEKDILELIYEKL